MKINTLESDFKNVISTYKNNIEKTISAQEWNELNSVLEARQSALELFFPKLDLASDKAVVLNIINNMQIDDADFLNLIQDKKIEMKKQFIHLKKSRKSIKAYQV